MKKKIITIVIVILVIVLGVVAWFYFKQGGTLWDYNNPGAATQQNQGGGSPLPSGETPNNVGNILTNDYFSIMIPQGWKETPPSQGTAAIVINANEKITDPAVQKINFKSYFSVSHNTREGKSDQEYFEALKDSLNQALSGLVFTQEKQIDINGRKADALEFIITQQGVDFKILLVAVKGNGDEMWVLSFNTSKTNWDGYKDLFYQIADSFQLK